MLEVHDRTWRDSWHMSRVKSRFKLKGVVTCNRKCTKTWTTTTMNEASLQ